MADLSSPTYDRLRRMASFARYATVMLIASMFIATHFPAHALPHHVGTLDKLLHGLVYMTMTLSVLTSWELTIGTLKPQHYFTVWLVGTLYGAFDEITQIPVGRHADVNDWICDLAGIVIGLTLYRIVSPVIFRLANFKFATQ